VQIDLGTSWSWVQIDLMAMYELTYVWDDWKPMDTTDGRHGSTWTVFSHGLFKQWCHQPLCCSSI